MKPEYIGVGNFDEDNYVYAYCKCPLPVDYAIKWPRIKGSKPHRYACICEDCGTAICVVTKSYGGEVYFGQEYEEQEIDFIQPKKTVGKLISVDVLDKIRSEIEQLPTNSRTNWNGCCPDIDYPEIEYVDVTKAALLKIIDKYKSESDGEK